MSVNPILVSERQARMLRYLAAARKRPVEEMLEEALYEYLARNGLDYKNRVSEPGGQVSGEELRAALDAVWASVETDLSPEEIEAEITATLEEMRQERLGRQQPLSA